MHGGLLIDAGLQCTQKHEDTPSLLDTCCFPTASIAGIADDPDARRAALPKVETDA